MTTYNKIKSFYDDIQFPGKYSKETLSFCNNNLTNIYLKAIDGCLEDNLSVLDVGSGSGLITNLFATRYKSKFTALDMSDSINYGKNYSKTHSIKNVTWIQQNFIEYTTEDKYDVIICQGVLHHIPDYKLAIAKLKSLLKPNGVLLLGLYHPWGKFLQKITNFDYKSEILRKDQLDHPYQISFTKSKIKKLCGSMKLREFYPRCFFSFKKSFITSGGLIIYIFENTSDEFY